MDAAPLNTSIIILCSQVGFTFGNEIVQMLSKICDVGRNWNKNFLKQIKRSSMCVLRIQREKPLFKSLIYVYIYILYPGPVDMDFELQLLFESDVYICGS